MKWYEKTWEWIKKYWGIVLSAVTLVIGYIFGLVWTSRRYRDAVSRAGQDIAELKAELAEARSIADQLGDLGRELGERADRIERDSEGIKSEYNKLRSISRETGSDFDRLDEISARIREAITELRAEGEDSDHH